MKLRRSTRFLIPAVLLIVAIALSGESHERESQFLGNAEDNARELIVQGRHIFRFDTYGRRSLLDRSACKFKNPSRASHPELRWLSG